MNALKRVALVLYALAGLACLAVLVVFWYGLYDFYDLPTPLYERLCAAMVVGIVVICVGLLVALARGLLSRKPGAICVMRVEGGEVSVTRGAIAAQAGHVVAGRGIGEASSVAVKARGRGLVRVRVKVAPYGSVDVTQEGRALHEALVEGLGAVCGERLGTVSVEFLEPLDAGAHVPAQRGHEVASEGEAPADGPVAVAAPSEAPSVSQGASVPDTGVDDAGAGDGIKVPLPSEREA